MGLVFLLSIAIVFAIISMGFYAGFVCRDCSDSFGLLLAAAVVPGACLGYIVDNSLASALWSAAFIMGVLVADLFRNDL